jgi:DNA-directed RNA polymerase subunit beta'
MPTTVGQVLVNDALPPRFRDYGRVMDSNGIEQVLEQIAREAPEEYAAVTKRLMDVGNSAAFDTGTTIRMSDLRPAYDKRPILQALDIAEEKIRSDKTLTDAQKSEMIEKLYDKANSRIMEDTYNAELARKNQLALQVASKARGNKVQLAAFISTPGTYSDPSGKMVPMFIRHSFAEGLTPAEYWAGSFGARNGVVSTKTATAKGGAFGKLLSASAIAQVITEEDCGTESGLPVKVDDDDNIGAVLAKPAGGYDAGTVITKNVLSDLRKDKRHDEIVVRSPTTCGCKSGICSKCAGIRETGGFPPIGYNLGTNAASAFAERITQSSLNTKHDGKVKRGKGQYQGFEMITSLAKVPKVFPDRATLSTVDGTVSKIEDAPQGGKYVFVTEQNGEEKRHYVAPGYDIDVKVGDEMEAGDQISDGVIDPSELVKYKGIGEARKYWASRFTKAMRDSGMPANRRNAEVLARTIMNTVKLENEDEAGEGLPGDVLTYTAWSTGYKPRKNSTFAPPTVASIGKYLEQPVLHYTIGTRITPSVIKTMKKFKVDRMMVNDTRPEVEPFMERIEDSNAEKKDWMARLGTTYLKSRLQEDVARGAESHLHSTEPYPGIAKGVEFGDWGQPLSKNKSEHFTY